MSDIGKMEGAGVGIFLKCRGSPAATRLLVTAPLFLASLTFRTLDMAVCATLPAGTHFIWHLLNGACLYQATAVLQDEARA